MSKFFKIQPNINPHHYLHYLCQKLHVYLREQSQLHLCQYFIKKCDTRHHGHSSQAGELRKRNGPLPYPY